jgi:hypothetical protein
MSSISTKTISVLKWVDTKGGHIRCHQCDREHAGKRKGGVIHARERAGKCKGKVTHAQMHENQTKQNFQNCQSLSLIVRMMKALTGSAYENPTVRMMMILKTNIPHLLQYGDIHFQTVDETSTVLIIITVFVMLILIMISIVK